MTRLAKVLGIAGLASVYLLQTPCTFAQHGFSVFPTLTSLGIDPFAAIRATLAGFTGGLTT